MLYDVRADRADPGYPQRVTDKSWPGLGAYALQIVAATNGRDAGKAYVFLSNGPTSDTKSRKAGLILGHNGWTREPRQVLAATRPASTAP